MIEKIHSFFKYLTGVQRLCVGFHFGTKQTIEFLEFWLLLLEQINKTSFKVFE